VAPFGLFKKKERKEDQAADFPDVSFPEAGKITIQESQELLQRIEQANLQSVGSRLAPIKESVSQSLKSVGQIAKDMEHEKIKLEDLEQRYKSIVENSRKAIVTALKRESAVELELPQSINDAKKFREKFEAMMNRLGEVSGSHRKVLNTFMKRNANLMKDEFEVLQKLLSQTKSIMSEFDEKRAPVVRCGSVLNTATQKVSSIRSADVSIETTEDQIVQAEKETQNMKAEIEAAKSSPEFSKAAAVSQKIEESRRHEKELRAQTVELFSHITRALTKYSYGVSKETEARLGVMSSEPWKLLYEDDLLPYSSLLSEVRKSIVSGSIQLKDSDRMVQYLDSILESLPGYQNKARSIRAELDSILQEDHSLFLKAREIEERIALRTEELARNKVYLEQQKKQNEERKKEVDSSLKEAQEILLQLTGRQYSISY
jgi:uncharacterized small protein (DUF1192 family)